jgi:hypothetical protein
VDAGPSCKGSGARDHARVTHQWGALVSRWGYCRCDRSMRAEGSEAAGLDGRTAALPPGGRQVVVRLVAGFPTSPSLLALNDQRDRQRVLAGDA